MVNKREGKEGESKLWIEGEVEDKLRNTTHTQSRTQTTNEKQAIKHIPCFFA
jgi:hypothetical protein